MTDPLLSARPRAWSLMALSMAISAPLAGTPARAQAQELAFGSGTWRGHGLQVEGLPLACRAFSNFGNGDTLAFVAFISKGSNHVSFYAFLSPGYGIPPAKLPATSIAAVLDRLGTSKSVTARAWVDNDQDGAIDGSRATRSIMFSVGALDDKKAAKFFDQVRNGNVLHVVVAGQERRYVLRSTFAALTELVGCAIRANDGEISPSSGMPPAREPPTTIAPRSPVTPPVQEVTSAAPVPVRPAVRALSSSGSGVVVAKDGYVLTNQHVVSGCASFGVRSVGSSENTASLVAQDATNDLALLKASTPFAQAATLRIDTPRLGESVTVYGFPLTGVLASSGNMTVGNVSALSGIHDDSRDVQITAAVQPGNSGGPLFDSSGLVVGIVQSKLDAIRAASVTGDIPQNVNFAIKIALAGSFLNANGIEPTLERRRTGIQPDDLSENMQKVTAQVLCYGGGR